MAQQHLTQTAPEVSALVQSTTETIEQAEASAQNLQIKIDELLQQFQGKAAGAVHVVHVNVQNHLRTILRNAVELNSMVAKGANAQLSIDEQTASTISKVTEGLPL